MAERAPGIALITNADSAFHNPALVLACELMIMGLPITVETDPVDAEGQPLPPSQFLAIRGNGRIARDTYRDIFFTPELRALTSAFNLKSTPPDVEECKSWDDDTRQRVLRGYWLGRSRSKSAEQAEEAEEKLEALGPQGLKPLSYLDILNLVQTSVKAAGINQAPGNTQT